MRARDPAPSRALVLGWLAASFALSAVTDWRVLAAAFAVAIVVFWSGAGRHLSRALRIALPLAALPSAAGLLLDRLAGRAGAGLGAFAALNLRAVLLAFLAFAVLSRADVFASLQRWPAVTRFLAIVLGQIHALRLLATESRLGLRSRLPRRPRSSEVIRGAGTITGTLLVLSGRNARDVADALRARGA